MSDFFQELITEYVNSRPKAKQLEPKRVAKRLGVKKRNFAEFLEAWYAVFGNGGETKNALAGGKPDGSRSASSARRPTLRGVIKRIGMRNGLFVAHPQASEGEQVGKLAPQELIIPLDDLHDAQVGDEVAVELIARRGGGDRRCGRVVEVLERATNSFVGTYDEFDGQGYVKIDGKSFSDPIWVGDPGAKGAVPGDKVVIEMLRFPTQTRGGEAVLTRVLGAKGDPGVDLLTIIHEYGLPDRFPDEVLDEARRQAERFDESDLSRRLDLTHETIITIDPVDARDFDDGISLAKNEAGHWVLGVHIADVAHFVKSGGTLDREAKDRGTSVYLPTQVLPMLPEVISNGLASLQQGRVRYTNSAFIEFTSDGVPVHTEFAKSAIKVTQRFAYEEVMPLICLHSGERGGVSPPVSRDVHRQTGGLTPPRSPKSAHVVAPEIRQLLCDMHELAMTLRQRRFVAGALDLNLPEVKLDFDKDGRVSGAHEVEHDESHQIIEEFMLAANIAVATKLNDVETAFLRRTHDAPAPLKLQAFAKFVTALGFSLNDPSQPRPRNRKSKIKTQKPSPYDRPIIPSKAQLQDLLRRVRGTPAEHAINYALLRSLKQAEYSGLPIGHYALAVRDYCHFTSPIRRYPDLTIHRLFDALASGSSGPCGRDDSVRSPREINPPGHQGRGYQNSQAPRGPSPTELEILGQHCSDRERRAAQAERELTKLKLLEFMTERIGDELEALITGVERFGLFCQGIELPVDGFVHISGLSEFDYFDFDSDSQSLIGRRTGKQFRLGDRVRVQVAHVDPDRRELDFRIVLDRPSGRRPRGEHEAAPSRSRKKQRTSGERAGPKKSKRRGRS
jgi:ribonuclease R